MKKHAESPGAEDAITRSIDDIPQHIQEVFVKRALLDARTAIKKKVSLDELAYMFFKSYVTGIGFAQSELYQVYAKQDEWPKYCEK